MTKEEYNRLVSASSKKQKYGARPSGGYASVKEHNRANELKKMQRAGLISDLREQVWYKLIPSQYRNGKLIERSCSYVADFVYFDRDKNLVVEDTKGFRTKEYIIKKKLMLYIHDIVIKEI